MTLAKTIVAVILECNGFEVIDLGVMVPCEAILAAAREHKADAIALSGFSSPGLEEMAKVAKEMKNENFDIPLMVGEATTSKLHTPLTIMPHYDKVVDTADASTSVATALCLLGDQADEFWEEIHENEEIAEDY